LSQLKDIKEKADQLKKDEEDFDVRREHKSDTKRETILSILAITIPAIAVVVGILIAIKVI
jgi:type IV secretory pathway component VirB8